MPKKAKSRMGRPPLPKGEKKKNVVSFKVDDGELKAIDRTARKLGVASRSDFIRDAVKGVVRRELSRGGRAGSR